jgi:hypothetical protein
VQSFGKNHWKIVRAQFLIARVLLPLAACAGICCFLRTALADGDAPLRETAQKLADRVATIPGLHGALRLEWHPDANWPEGESARWQVILKGEFEKRTLNLTEDAGAPALEVFAAETPTQVVLTTKTRVSEREEVRIVAVTRSLLPSGLLPPAPIRLERQMIYESEDRILDASSLGDSENEGLAILLYRNFQIVALRVDPKGAVKGAVSLNSSNAKPSRDPRAELTARGASVSVQLPAKVCEFSWEASGEVRCHVEKPSPSDKSGWRSQTLLTSPCDGNSWKLQYSGSDPNAREVLQVVPDGTTRGTSAAVLSEFPGPIVGANGERNPSSALVIAGNLRTGNYEIYKITLACGN